MKNEKAGFSTLCVHGGEELEGVESWTAWCASPAGWRIPRT